MTSNEHSSVVNCSMYAWTVDNTAGSEDQTVLTNIEHVTS